jgi:hypothetical protein
VTQNVSVPAAKRRFRTAQWKIERLERELMELLEALPAPSREELEAMLARRAPWTLEAWLLGALQLACFHLMEAKDVAGEALAKTTRGLKQEGGQSYRFDLLYSLGHVIASRAEKRK